MKTADNKLFNFTAGMSFENQSKTESIETCNLTRKFHTAREAFTFANEVGNKKRAKTKQELCEKLEDESE